MRAPAADSTLLRYNATPIKRYSDTTQCHAFLYATSNRKLKSMKFIELPIANYVRIGKGTRTF